MKQRRLPEATLLMLVILHLGCAVAHAAAHLRARVALSNAALLFVLAIVFVGPVAGLVLQRSIYPRGGAWLIAVTLAGAFCFGLVNHFLIPGTDHVNHVTGAWRVPFEATAVSLAVTELFGSGLAVLCAAGERRQV
jgi:uncharacterized membrane protein YsdA (DUF1294 family)